MNTARKVVNLARVGDEVLWEENLLNAYTGEPDIYQFTGTVTDILSDGIYRVEKTSVYNVAAEKILKIKRGRKK